MLPEWLEPMAPTLTQERFVGPAWLFERKHDGIRLLAYRDGHDVRLFSRNRLPQHHPEILAAIASLDIGDAILDGEVAWDGGATLYHVFDVLWLDGQDVTALPLDERRRLLDRLPLGAPLHRVEPLDDPQPWELARREGWEGVVAKRRDAPYVHRRSPLWLKMKCEESQELVVGGFTDPQGARSGLGALLVGYFDGGDFVYAGRVGTGFDGQGLRDLRAELDALVVSEPPFTEGSGLPRLRAHWVRPELVVQVAFLAWTRHGKLRHSRFLGVRRDKLAREVGREAW